MEMFRNRRLVIATMHAKESVISPALEAALGVHCIVPSAFDTDRFGTFSGEVKRALDPLEIARMKCHAAMQATGCDLAIASEGSFGPHPIYFFSSADEELLLLCDRKSGLEIFVRELSTSTNFMGRTVSTWKELEAFAAEALFPSHALILRNKQDGSDALFKGITEKCQLEESFQLMMQRFGTAYVETDMRAMHNPTRMNVIAQATEKLIHKVMSACPSCAWPGFDVTDVKTGLPCSDCGMPTQSVMSTISCCASCGYTLEHLHPKGRIAEEPRFCDYCNP
jgi:hypothetical protein